MPKRKPVAGVSKSAKPARPNNKKSLRLGQLTGRAEQIALLILNSIAFRQYGDCCGLEELATKFGTTPGRLQTSLQKLKDAGLVTIQGSLYPTVYPTVELLRQQDPRLSQTEAEKIIRRLERA